MVKTNGGSTSCCNQDLNNHSQIFVQEKNGVNQRSQTIGTVTPLSFTHGSNPLEERLYVRKAERHAKTWQSSLWRNGTWRHLRCGWKPLTELLCLVELAPKVPYLSIQCNDKEWRWVCERFRSWSDPGYLQDVFDQKAFQVPSIRYVPYCSNLDPMGMARILGEKEEKESKV